MHEPAQMGSLASPVVIESRRVAAGQATRNPAGAGGRRGRDTGSRGSVKQRELRWLNKIQLTALRHQRPAHRISRCKPNRMTPTTSIPRVCRTPYTISWALACESPAHRDPAERAAPVGTWPVLQAKWFLQFGSNMLKHLCMPKLFV